MVSEVGNFFVFWAFQGTTEPTPSTSGTTSEAKKKRVTFKDTGPDAK